ncbi:uncharacterized protein LOC126965591 [Leptidea sinapis]|uniref:uncharacterized protein LOC126965591 n=1 Tax=Leptidea sinapis TaxID=189913 RepID=UPI00212B9E65|nr:uncharacterized protein LOC126965591 [Leptidea sinapis]
MRLIIVTDLTSLVLLSCLLRVPAAQYTCPIGFSIAYTREQGEPVCYQIKGPELFTEKYKDCDGNLYSSKLYLQLNFTSPNKVLWTEYRSLYPGGIFVDWSYSKSMGAPLDSPFEVNIDPILDPGEELCVAIDTVSNFTAVRCTDRHYRYCFTKPYPEDSSSDEGCDGLEDSLRLWSPVSTCIKVVSAVGGGKVRATWRNAQELCAKRGASLMNRGWLYSNHRELDPGYNTTFPLGVVMTNVTHLQYDTIENQSEIPVAEWRFKGSLNISDNKYGAVRERDWYLVNDSYIFYDVICETGLPIRQLDMDIQINIDNEITLTVNDSIDRDKIYCYTDSEKYYPVNVKKQRKDHTNTFVLIPKGDGYYWCTHDDVYNYHTTESNKVLFIREKQSIINKYAVKIKHNKKITLDDIDELSDDWKDVLSEYILLVNKYEDMYGKLDTNDTEEILKTFVNLNPEVKKESTVAHNKKVKRLYLDGQTVVLHLELSPGRRPAPPGRWRDLEILYMKPTYYCRGSHSTTLELGTSKTEGCVTLTCVGDFDEGVQLVSTATINCIEELITTTDRSTPEEQLQQVMDDLYTLVNDSGPIFLDDISNVFDQVDEVLEERDDLEIPGRLLHLLDQLGATVQLEDAGVASAVRGNIALVMAAAGPDHRVRGLRIAARDTDIFTDDAFGLISDDLNSTMLESDNNEAVVVLPASVSETAHRVSFVVFRTDRAFRDNGTQAVNSRVLSVKVDNLTHFQHGEVIDIHLSPLSANVTRNTSRTCGYWEFLEDNTGFWSQEGCTFIKSTQPGTLDTCRCTHMTHFAEILVPRSVFSEQHESALEIMTVVGCCLSILGLSLVGVTAALFRSWRREYSNKVWLQLCMAILLLALTFLIVVFAQFEEYNTACMLVGVALHYSVLASFCWMLVAATLSYRRLVLVFSRDATHRLLRASAFSWGAPCAVVGILLSVAPHSYAGRFEEKTPSGSFCYPTGVSLWVTVYAPICVIVVVNWTLFSLIVRSVFASRRIQRHGDSKEAMRCASVSCLLVFLFGLPWVFGLFAQTLVGAYLFTLTASYQGFILFLFFVLCNKKTRDLWLNKLKIKQTRKVPVTSSTFSNRSTNWRPNTNNSTESKVSKPKSLSTPDDSRFS